jgi:hypothetical protein
MKLNTKALKFKCGLADGGGGGRAGRPMQGMGTPGAPPKHRVLEHQQLKNRF